MEVDPNVAQWSLVVGFFLPPALALLMQTPWPSQVKAVVAFLACLVAGAITAYIVGDLNGEDFVTAALTILTTAMATYSQFWKPTDIAPTIEKATSVGGSP